MLTTARNTTTTVAQPQTKIAKHHCHPLRPLNATTQNCNTNRLKTYTHKAYWLTPTPRAPTRKKDPVHSNPPQNRSSSTAPLPGRSDTQNRNKQKSGSRFLCYFRAAGRATQPVVARGQVPRVRPNKRCSSACLHSQHMKSMVRGRTDQVTLPACMAHTCSSRVITQEGTIHSQRKKLKGTVATYFSGPEMCLYVYCPTQKYPFQHQDHRRGGGRRARSDHPPQKPNAS